MEILFLRTSPRERLSEFFSEQELSALHFYREGTSRTKAMFEFAERCYKRQAPTVRHPLSGADSLCTHSNSFADMYNTLHFGAPEAEEFVIIQRVTFMDAIIFPERGVTVIFRSIKEQQAATVASAVARLRIQKPSPRRFRGFIVSHHRPYHYLYESLPAMLWFERTVMARSEQKPHTDLVQFTGGDYMPLNALFPDMACSTVNSSSLNWTSKVTSGFYVKLGFSGMWDKDPHQVEAINLMDAELRDLFAADPQESSQPSTRPVGVLFDVSDAKGTWETLAEDIPVIVSELQRKLGRELKIYLDGWTLAATPTRKELKRAKEEATFASRIAKSLPKGVTSQSLVGVSPFVKMSFMSGVDAVVCRFSTGSLVPSRVMHKPGIVHHSGQAGIFRKLHFHGPEAEEVTGTPIDVDTAARDQDISYSLDATTITKKLLAILQR